MTILAFSTQKSCISFLDMSSKSFQVTNEHLNEKFTIQGHRDISRAFCYNQGRNEAFQIKTQKKRQEC